MPDSHYHGLLSDPPYGLTDHVDAQAILHGWLDGGTYDVGKAGLMGMRWDATVPPPAFWAEVCRAMKPGGHVVAFAASRMIDLAMLAMRLGGLEIVSTIAYLRGSGWPKCGDIGRMIDKSAGATRKVVGHRPAGGGRSHKAWRTAEGRADLPESDGRTYQAITVPATALAAAFDDYSGELKPSYEPIIVARRPMPGTYARNAAEHGVAGFNIKGCRIEVEGNENRRYPPNAVIEHDERCTEGACAPSCPVAALDAQAGVRTSGKGRVTRRAGEERHVFGETSQDVETSLYGDSGSAARFYYTSRVAPRERHAGCDGLTWVVGGEGPLLVLDRDLPAAQALAEARKIKLAVGCPHPTLKAQELCAWLARLILPPALSAPRRLFVPFAGVGSEVIGAARAGWDEICAAERDASYAYLMRLRLRAAGTEPDVDDLLYPNCWRPDDAARR